MRRLAAFTLFTFLLAGCAGSGMQTSTPVDQRAATPDGAQLPNPEEGFLSLFNGRDLSGWQIGGATESFEVENGAIVVNGPVSHLFYMGDVMDHDFTNFHFKADVMTMPSANGGLYFHTEFQPTGFPAKGFEVQVNNSQSDWKRTGGLYNVSDLRETFVRDGEWYTQEIIVQDRRVITKINGLIKVDWTEPNPPEPPQGNPGRVISSGTFAIQAHDPGSTVYVRNIRVKPLPD